MYDVITIGAATRDAFIRSAVLELHPNAKDAGTVDVCFPLGAKIDIEELVMETGGGATNAAVTFARLGLRAATVAAVGPDANGRQIIAVLHDEGVNTDFIQTLKGQRTGYSAILLSGTGERTVLVYRGASEKLNAAKIPWSMLKTRWFYVSSLGGNLTLMKRILAHAKRIGAKVAWNPGSREIKHGLKKLTPLLRNVDLLNVNKEEAAELAGIDGKDMADILKKLRSLPRRALIITDGERGTTAAEGDDVWHSDTLDVPRSNVTGAGDAFGSGLVAGLLTSDDLRHALAVGTLNASGVVQQTGAKHGILKKYPSAKDIKKVGVTARKA